MSSQERKKILQMVEEGSISAEEASHLMRAIEADDHEGGENTFETEQDFGSEGGGSFSTPEFESVKARARKFSTIPLWIGVGMAVLSAWGLFAIQQSAGVNFWFFCLLFPLMLGVLLIAIGSAGQSSKWLYVNVDRTRQNDWPRNITLGFPLPLQLTSWFMRNFGHNIHGVSKNQLDGIAEVLETTDKSGEPFVVNVEDDDGDRVQVYIG